MKVIKPSFQIRYPTENVRETVYSQIASAARTCYKSEQAQSYENDIKLIKNLVKNNHQAMLEHATISVVFLTDRGISHELVRHREASFAQESTRYCAYSKDRFDNQITYMSLTDAIELDPKTKGLDSDAKCQILATWLKACEQAEKAYMKMIDLGCSPQVARSVLNNSTKTELVITANIREWRHILSLRAAGTTGAPHPQMRELMLPLLNEFKQIMPELFGDIKA